MHWIILCLIAAFGYSIAAFIDNYNTDIIFKSRKPQAIKAINGFLYLIIAAIIFIFIGVKESSLEIILLSALSGVIASIASIPYYLGLREEESTTAAIYYQLIPVFCIFADVFLLGKTLTTLQIFGFCIILTAPFIIILARRRKSARKFEIRASLFFLTYAALLSVSNIIFAKTEQRNTDPMTLFFWFTLGRAAFDIISTAIMPSWRKRIKQVRKDFPIKLFVMAALTLGICSVADFLIRLSFSTTNTSFATVVSNTAELIMTFMLGIILTVIWPNFGREKLNRHIVLSHLIATVIVVVGVILTQI